MVAREFKAPNVAVEFEALTAAVRMPLDWLRSRMSKSPWMKCRRFKSFWHVKTVLELAPRYKSMEAFQITRGNVIQVFMLV